MDTQYIKNIPIFSALSDENAQIVLDSVQMKSFGNGDMVFQQGDVGNGLYGIVMGTVEVILDDNVVAKLGPNDFFGEMSLIAEEPRSATVRATSDLSAFFLSKEAFDQIKGELGEEVKKEILRRAEENSNGK